MKIDIIISAGDIKEKKVQDKTVVVIDMLRATSVIITAIANGCKEIIPVLAVEEALELVRENRHKHIVGGERNAVKIEGFDCSNSPLEYTRDLIKDKTIVITTTNGTRAIKNCESARHIYMGAMINAVEVAKAVISKDNDIVLVNAGTYDEFSMDDFICSGYIIDCILKLRNQSEGLEIENADSIELSDIAKTAHYIYKSNEDITSYIENASHYNRLEKLGLQEDLQYCCQKSIIEVVPEYKDGVIK